MLIFVKVCFFVHKGFFEFFFQISITTINLGISILLYLGCCCCHLRKNFYGAVPRKFILPWSSLQIVGSGLKLPEPESNPRKTLDPDPDHPLEKPDSEATLKENLGPRFDPDPPLSILKKNRIRLRLSRKPDPGLNKFSLSI